MISDWELWAAANEVIRQHGDEAPVFAATRQVELGEAGDAAGSRAWLQIGLKIIELRRDTRGEGERLQ